jgi:ribose transport system substrate-binding protein/inositol transport system substrate-binding protein
LERFPQQDNFLSFKPYYITEEECMKKYLNFATAAAVGLSLAWALPTAAQVKAKPDQKYALLMSHMSNEFTVALSGAVQEKAKELGADLTVFDARNEIAQQISQVETAVTQGYTGIVIEPAAITGLDPALKAAKEAGLKVVTVVQKVSGQSALDAFVGVDPVGSGEMQMTNVAKAIGGKGNIALLLGPLGSDAQIGRTKGYENVLAKYPDIKVAFQQTANWRTDEALKLTENWLQTGTPLAAIVANNDDMALGAVKAAKDAQLTGKINITGIDAVPNALAAVKEGSLSASLSEGVKDQGMIAMETVVKLANGEKVPATISVDSTLVTSENVANFMK